MSDGLRRFSDPDLQAALVALNPRNGDILAIVGGRDFKVSQFNRATRSRRQPGSAFKPLLFAAALEHGFSPVSVLSGLATIRPQGPEEWSPRNAGGETPDALTLRAALLESNNRAATALQQRLGARPVLRLASDAGLRDHAERPVAVAGDGRGHAARPHGGVRDVPERRLRGPPERDRPRPRRGWRLGLREPAAHQRVHVAADRVPDGLDARGRHRSRHRVGGEIVGRPVCRRRQNRHDERLQGRLVRRLLVVGRGRRLGRIRSAEADRRQRLRLALRPADLERFHEARRAAAGAGGVRRPPPGCTTSRSAGSRISSRSRAVRSTPSTSRPETTCRPASARSTRAASSSASGARSMGSSPESATGSRGFSVDSAASGRIAFQP